MCTSRILTMLSRFLQATGYLNVLAEEYEQRLVDIEDLKVQKDVVLRTRDWVQDELANLRKTMSDLEALHTRAKNANGELNKIKASIELEKTHILKEKEEGIAVVKAQVSSHLVKLKKYFDKESEVWGLRAEMNQVRGIVDFLRVFR